MSLAPGSRTFTRRVHYIGGFYMGGPAFYRATLVREAARHARVRGVSVEVADEGGTDDGPLRRFVLSADRPEGRVETLYALLRWEDIVLARLARPWTWRIAAGAATFVDYLVNGASLRLLRLSRRFGLMWLFPFVFYAGATVVAALAGLGLDAASRGAFGGGAFVFGLAAAAGTLLAAGTLGRYAYAFLLLNNWIFSREIALDRAPDLWERLDCCAQRVAEDLGRADEVAVIGHSFGASLAPIIAARASALASPSGGRLTVLTLGASPVVIGLHPAAHRFREGLRQAACDPAIAWIDVSSSYDSLNVKRFDPVAGFGLGEDARPPVLLDTRFARRAGGGFRRKLGLMRLHMQFIKAAESVEGYDYIGLVTGAAPIPAMLGVDIAQTDASGPDRSLSPPCGERAGVKGGSQERDASVSPDVEGIRHIAPLRPAPHLDPPR